MTFPLRHKCILMASVFHVVDGGTSLSEIRPFLALLRCRNLPGAFSSRQVEGLEGRDVHGLPLHACSTSFERPASGGGASLPAGPKRGGFFFTRNEPNGRDFRSEATGHEPKGVSSRSMDLCTEETRTHTHTHKGRLYIVGPRSGIGRQRRRACRGSAKDGRMRALKEDMDVRGKHRSQERLLLAILPSRYPMHRNCSLHHQQPTPPFPIMRPLFSSTFLHDRPHFSRFVLPFHGTPNSILHPRR